MSGELLFELAVNGRAFSVRSQPTATLLTVLRDELMLTGAKRGCNQGICGACTVLIDGKPMRSCLSLAVNVVGQQVTTIEALRSRRRGVGREGVAHRRLPGDHRLRRRARPADQARG